MIHTDNLLFDGDGDGEFLYCLQEVNEDAESALLETL